MTTWCDRTDALAAVSIEDECHTLTVAWHFQMLRHDAPVCGAYVILSAVLTVANRFVLRVFPFPLTFTAMHMVLNCTLCVRSDWKSWCHWRALSVVGAFTACQVSLNNWSLVYLDLADNQVRDVGRCWPNAHWPDSSMSVLELMRSLLIFWVGAAFFSAVHCP